MTAWVVFLTRYKHNEEARLLLQIGGEYPSRTLASGRAAYRDGRLSASEFMRWHEIIIRWRMLYRSPPIEEANRDGEEWVERSPGGFQRLRHGDPADSEEV